MISYPGNRITVFAAHGLNTGLFGILAPDHAYKKAFFDFATQSAFSAGYFSWFPGTGLRNVLPREGTRTLQSELIRFRSSVKKCITPQGDENSDLKNSVLYAVITLKNVLPRKGTKTRSS